MRLNNPAGESKLFLKKLDGYEQAGVDSAVLAVFGHFGGVERFVRPGDKVILKVNLVAGHRPERRVTTDPSVVRAVAKIVLKAGGHPVIADSPGIDNFSKAAEKAGFTDVARELNIPCVELNNPVPLPTVKGASFQRIEVARSILEADAIINLPKMKTHGQMFLTLGVKNMFGCIVAQRKAEWHYKVGLRRELFASLLLDLWNATRPALTILDGVVGMDGLGPTSGNPYAYGLIAGAEDALTMDFWLCRMMGMKLEDFPLWQAAKTRNLMQCHLNETDLAGDFLPAHVFKNVQIPKLSSLGFLPRFPFSQNLEQAMTSRPTHRPDRCIGCGKCVAVCKAEAITLQNTKLAFDYKKCIRCYCCHEMCPVDAIGFKDGIIMKIIKFFGR